MSTRYGATSKYSLIQFVLEKNRRVCINDWSFKDLGYSSLYLLHFWSTNTAAEATLKWKKKKKTSLRFISGTLWTFYMTIKMSNWVGKKPSFKYVNLTYILTLIWPNHEPTCRPSFAGSWPPLPPQLWVWSGALSLGLTPQQTSRARYVLHWEPCLHEYRRTELSGTCL